MKTSQSFGVHFTIKREKAKDGVTNVYASITVNKERLRFALKHLGIVIIAVIYWIANSYKKVILPTF